MKVTDILKAIQKLNPAEKHRLKEYLIDKPGINFQRIMFYVPMLGVLSKHMLMKKDGDIPIQI